MISPAWREKPIARNHDGKSFACGDAVMNDFLRRYSSENRESGAAKTFLSIDNGNRWFAADSHNAMGSDSSSCPLRAIVL